jgi:hypothetical protein
LLLLCLTQTSTKQTSLWILLSQRTPKQSAARLLLLLLLRLLLLLCRLP